VKKGEVSLVERGGLDLDFWERPDFAGVEDWEDMSAEALEARRG
jgi:hypothetical protein